MSLALLGSPIVIFIIKIHRNKNRCHPLLPPSYSSLPLLQTEILSSCGISSRKYVPHNEVQVRTPYFSDYKTLVLE